MNDQRAERRSTALLPKAVVLLGFTSFFTDVASEMIFPLLPAFLVTLGAGPAFLGIIEGAADATASLLKLAMGYASDRTPRKKPLVLFGYLLASAIRPLVAVATSPWQVFAVRLTDRVGKGIRSTPRDALIASSAPPGTIGRAFGFHRAMDHAGAVVGPLLATSLLAIGVSLRNVFLIAAIPGVVACLCVLFVREPRDADRVAVRDAPVAGHLPARLRTYFAILLLFCLANSSDAFLLLRAKEVGVPVALIPIVWTVLHISKLVSSYVGGAWSDRKPRAHLIASGWLIYALAYVGFGVARTPLQIWGLMVLYGCYYGLTEPAEKALVKDLAPEIVRGRALGMYNFLVGASALPASLFIGWLWESFGARVALGAGAIAALVASGLLVLWQWQSPEGVHSA